MSYEAAAALQAAIYAVLSEAMVLSGVPVFDAAPAGGLAETFILIGPEDVSDASDLSGHGAVHRFVVSVISSASGFLEAKTIAAEVSQLLVDATPVLGRGKVVSIGFQKAAAKRVDQGEVRRIDLTFRARIEI